MSELVIMNGAKIYTTSLIISDNLNVAHKSIMQLLTDHSYVPELQRFENDLVRTKGRPLTIALLTELQALILVSLMKNSKEVISFKVNLAKAFLKYREIAFNRSLLLQNAEYQAKRLESKTIRKECTDTIQEFTKYAINQGSKNALRYYSNISTMELKGLFLLEQKFPNARDMMNVKQLNLIEIADEAVRLAINEGMDQEMHYKDIYLLAKSRVEALAKIFPPSPLPQLLMNKEEKQCLTN